MKKLFLLFVLMLLSLAASADDVEYEKRKTIHVATAGTLPDLILNYEKNLIEELTITGELNGTDLAFLREMAGQSRMIHPCFSDIDDISDIDEDFVLTETQGKLIDLDIFNASIVSGGSPYLQLMDGDDRLTNYYSSDNTIPVGLFWRCRLSSIKLPQSISNIERSAFSECSGLTSITIPSSVTSIGYGVFNGCSSLTSVISEIESPFAIDNSVFDGIPSYAQLIVPKGKKSAYQSKAGWSQFTNIVEVGGVGYAFEKDGLYYRIGTNNTVSVIYGNTKYSGDIVIPSQVTYLGTTYNVTSIGKDAFNSCTGLTSITIPNSVTSIGWCAFEGCSALKSVTIPSGTYIGESAFSVCSGLTSVTFSGSVGCADQAFCGCNNLNAVHISDLEAFLGSSFEFYEGPGSNPLYYAHHLYLNGEEVKNLVIPNGLTIINDWSLAGCTGLTSVTIPSSVESIGHRAFGGCSGLTSIQVESGNQYYDSRNNCNAIIDSNNQLIVGCKNTIIPNSVSSIGSFAFSGQAGLTSITIPQNVTSIDKYAFYGCTGLIYVTFPSNLTSIGSSAFESCENLTYIYCKAVNVPDAFYDAFSNPGEITIVVPYESLNAYQTTEPWKKFTISVPIDSSDFLQASEKCLKPTISIVDGKFIFNCETSNVNYNWSISTPYGNNGYGGSAPSSITLNVFATKLGYLPSDVATYEFSGLVGDVNNDGKVNVADHVKLSDIIMDQK